jgi:peptidoglycan/xylan/chitin deacetylase (PgdA/CDA1 family)
MHVDDLVKKDQQLWDIFTLKEEYDSPFRDHHDRFPYSASRNRQVFEPVVSKYLVEHGFHMEYPEGKPFAVCLTHDIDELYQTTLMKGKTALQHLRRADIPGCLRSISRIPAKKGAYWNFSNIMELEERFGAKSTFYFMAQSPGDPDYSYDIEDCRESLGEITDRGWEVGLHGGYSVYNDPTGILEQKEHLERTLNKKITGYRNHFLQFLVPETWEHLQKAGFHYDTTLGYADCTGFRNGMCHPFRPYNLTLNHTIDIVEIPLTIMEETLSDYMNLGSADAWKITTRLIDTVADCHGVITLLWHNHQLAGNQRQFYERILTYCSGKNAWMTSGEEIAALVSRTTGS